MRSTHFLIPILLVAATGAAKGESVLSENEYLSALTSEHPAAVSLTNALGSAEASRRQAALLQNPTFEALSEQPDDLPRETVWSVAWMPPLDGRRSWAIRESEAGFEAEKASLQSGLNTLRLELRRTYADWAAGYSRTAIFRNHVGRLESLAHRMWQRAESGEESLLDARRLQIASETSRAAMSQATAIETQAKTTALAWIQPDANSSSSQLPAVQPELPKLPELPAEMDSARQPDMVAASFRVDQAEALERLSKRGIAAPEFVLGWKTIEGSVIESDGPVFGLSWALPIFDRRQPDRLAAERAVDVAHANSEWIARRTTSDAKAARDAYAQLRQSALSAQDKLVGIEDVARAATASYEQGESSVTDLLDTLRAVLESRLVALELYQSALEAHRKLELAIGRDLTSGGLS